MHYIVFFKSNLNFPVTCLGVEEAVCCCTSFAGVCTLLALSEDLDKDGQGNLVALGVLDLGAGIGLDEAALGLDSHLAQDSLSVLVYLDILDQGTFEVVDGYRHVGFWDHDVAVPLALHGVVVVVVHNDLYENPDTFSVLDVFLVQDLVVGLFEHLDDALKDLVSTDLGVEGVHPGPDDEVCHLLLTGHIVPSWLDHSAGPAYLAFLVSVGHSQQVEVLCFGLVPSVSGQA